MSALLHSGLQVLLCPDRVALQQVEHRLTRRGVQQVLKECTSVPAIVAGSEAEKTAEQPWGGALRALDIVLPTYPTGRRKLSATVILSNQFVRYAVVPWSDLLSDDAERLAFAQQCFREIYGDAADLWEPRLSPDRDGASQLASAVDQRLLEDLRTAFGRLGVSLVSIQPHLMTVFNGFPALLKKRSAWLALVEPGNLCLAVLHRGEWARSRSFRIGPDWQAELLMILEREAYLVNADEQARDVFLWAPQSEADIPSFAGNDGWNVQRLKPERRPGFWHQTELSVAL